MRKIINIEVLEALPIDGENKTLILLAEKAPINLKVGERVQYHRATDVWRCKSSRSVSIS